MSYKRFRMDLAIKEPLPKLLEEELDDIKLRLLILQKYAEKINRGRPNEEDTRRLDEHTCNHDTGKRCERPHKLEVSPRRQKEKKRNDTMAELRSLAWIPLTKWGLARRK